MSLKLRCTVDCKLFTLLLIAVIAGSASAQTVVVSDFGAGGAIPDGPPGFDGEGGQWNATPGWPALVSATTLPSRIDRVTSVELLGFSHAFRGDVHVYLENPAGERFNLIVRPGYHGGMNWGDNGNYVGDTYTIVPFGGASLVQGAADIPGGSYNQHVGVDAGVWTSTVFPISNAPMQTISGSAGTWKLHVRDWAVSHVGSLGLWRLIGEDLTGSATSFCYGDGSGVTCPCGAEQNGGLRRGCKNSKPGSIGCLLTAVHSTLGTPNPSCSVTKNELGLRAAGMLPGSYTIFLQGTATVNDGLGDDLAGFDGLACVGGTLVRLGRINTLGGTSTIGGVAGVAGLIGAETKHYQAVYRNAVSFCTPSTLNTSNGLTVYWTP